MQYVTPQDVSKTRLQLMQEMNQPKSTQKAVDDDDDNVGMSMVAFKAFVTAAKLCDTTLENTQKEKENEV